MANPTYDLITYLYAPVWEADNRYHGKKYRALGRDMAEGKLFLQANPGIIDDPDFVVEFQEHAIEYLKDQFEGAVNMNHPAWLFLRNYGKYMPKRRTKEGVPSVPSVMCYDCSVKGKRTIHKADEQCPVCTKEAV